MGCTLEKNLIDQTIAFHGHRCPGLMIGIRAAELALQRLGETKGKDVVAIVETDMCGVDAIQFLTGCTFGKGNLIHKDIGKIAFNFYDRDQNIGFRLLFVPDVASDLVSELRSLMKKTEEGMANEDDQIRLQTLRNKLEETYMAIDLERMFLVTEPPWPVPKPAKILQSLRCETCGEMTMESRTRRFDGKVLCLPCFEKVEQKI